MSSTELTFGHIARAKGIDPSTPFRWVRYGIVVNGRRIYLQAIRRGGRWYTDEESLSEFERACTAAARGENPARKVRPSCPSDRREDPPRSIRHG